MVELACCVISYLGAWLPAEKYGHSFEEGPHRSGQKLNVQKKLSEKSLDVNGEMPTDFLDKMRFFLVREAVELLWMNHCASLL